MDNHFWRRIALASDIRFSPKPPLPLEVHGCGLAQGLTQGSQVPFHNVFLDAASWVHGYSALDCPGADCLDVGGRGEAAHGCGLGPPVYSSGFYKAGKFAAERFGILFSEVNLIIIAVQCETDGLGCFGRQDRRSVQLRCVLPSGDPSHRPCSLFATPCSASVSDQTCRGGKEARRSRMVLYRHDQPAPTVRQIVAVIQFAP